MERIKLSILMNTYNSELTVDKAIKSVQNQSYKNWELIILDNASRDSTVEILKDYEKSDSRISVIYGECNIGWAYGTRECLSKATGEYMTFLAADDFYNDSETFEDIIKLIDANNPDIIWLGTRFVEYAQGKYLMNNSAIPSCIEYSDSDYLNNVYETIRNCYYNSMSHFTRIEYLKEMGVDFAEPFYADCESMTELMCNTHRMVCLEKDAYSLTVDTSKTKQAVIHKAFDRQWKPIKKMIIEKGEYNKAKIGYIAVRILSNEVGKMRSVVQGCEIRDMKMNQICLSEDQKREWIEDALYSWNFRDMLYYSGDNSFYNDVLECLRKLPGSENVNQNEYEFSNNIDSRIQRLYRQIEVAEDVKYYQGLENAMYVVEECLDLFDEILPDLDDYNREKIISKLKMFY